MSFPDIDSNFVLVCFTIIFCVAVITYFAYDVSSQKSNNKKVLFKEEKKVKILFKEEGKFLDLSGVPDVLKIRSGLKKYLYLRDCYDPFVNDILNTMSETSYKTVAILGTTGIGKSSQLLVTLKLLIENPAKFGLTTRSFYFQTVVGEIWFYCHVYGSDFLVRLMKRGEQLDSSIPLFADMEGTYAAPKEHTGISFIFTSFIPSRYKVLTKNGLRMVMSTWSADEQAYLFNSEQFKGEYGAALAQRAYDNIQFHGGSVGSSIQEAKRKQDPTWKINHVVDVKGSQVCARLFSSCCGGCGAEDEISDVLIHRNPRMKLDGSYDYNAESCAHSFASPYVLKRLLLNDTILVTKVRNKYNGGTYSSYEDGKEFELLCMHGFKISDVELLAQPLSHGARPIKVRFPAKAVLVLNWRKRANYLERDVLYIPPYGNLESGSGFCLIKLGQKWTLVILQITIAEKHPMNQNGIEIIRDCYTKNSNVKVEDIVIMFIIPVNGKLKTSQQLVTQNGEVGQDVSRSVTVSAQYKIENELTTVAD